MKIFDCFMYFDEDLLLDLRLNILDKFVDKFVIVESNLTHTGKLKEFKFDINKFILSLAFPSLKLSNLYKVSLLNVIDLTPEQIALSDMNEDQGINILDIVLLIGEILS